MSYNRGGGGGGGGGGYNRRFNNERGQHHHHHNQQQHHGSSGRAVEAAPVVTREQQLAGLIVRIGDKSGTNLARMVLDLCDTIRPECGANSAQREHVLKTVLLCAAELPLKAPIYGAVVGVLNAVEPAFGLSVVERVGDQISALLVTLAAPIPLRQQDVDEAHRIAVALRRRLRLLLRFAAELCNAHVVAATAMIDLLQLLLDQSVDALDVVDARADSALPADVALVDKCVRRADFFAGLACDTLPWCAAALRRLKPLNLATLFAALQRFFDRRLVQPLAALRAVAGGDAAAAAAAADGLRSERDALQLRWERLLAQQEGAWLLAAKQHHVLTELQDKLHVAVSHDISNRVGVPNKDGDGAVMYPPVAFEFELLTDAERAPTLQAGDVAVVREYVRDVLDSFNADHVGAAKFLRAMPLPEGTNEDAIVVETLFTELLALPRAAFPLPFYTAVLGNLCQQPGSGVPKVLGRVALRLWKHAAALDVGVSDRFVRWLALHLSNFEYTWAWAKWAQTTALPDDDPQRLMVTEVILACVRLSYVDQIKEKLPEPLHAVLPPPTPTAALAYANDDAGVALLDAMQRKETTVAVARLVAASYGAAGLTPLLDLGPTVVDEDTADGAAGAGADEPAPLSPAAAERRLCAFFEALLKAGQQSFSHLLAVIERNEPLAKRLVKLGGAEAQRRVVDVVAAVWHEAPQHQVIALDRLQTYGIIDAPAVVDWAFDAAHVRHFRHGYVRDILRNAVRWAVQAARTSAASKSAGAALAERNVDDALFLLVERAAALQLVAANDSPVTLHFMRGVVLDIVRSNAPEIAPPLRERIEAIENVEQLELDSALAVGVAV